MEVIFNDYLEKFLGLYFLYYPKDLVPSLYPYFISIQKELIADIQSKYSQYDTEILLTDKFFSVLQLDTTIEAIFYYRLERAIFLEHPKHTLLDYLANLMRIKTGIEIYYSTEIGQSFNIQHGSGIVIGARNKIGHNFIIHQGATIGQRRLYSPQESILIGNNVTIFAGAKVVGNVRIGDNVQIGANAVLLHDAEPNSTYVGVPARKINNNRRDIKL